MEVGMISTVIGIVALMVIVIYVKANMKICPPNEVMIFSGRKFKGKEKDVVGYRVIRGGRALKIPLIETVHTLSLSTIPLDMDVEGALTKGTIPVTVKVMANIKIAGSIDDGLGNAIERFLGKSPSAISATGKEIIEGTLRGVLATMDPEEANTNRITLANQVAKEASEDMKRMGLILDTLKIQKIKDDSGYLDAIARKKNAEVQRDARIVEADSNAEASRKESEGKKISDIASIESRRSVIETEMNFRTQQAEWESKANHAEEKAKMAGDISRMEELTVLEAKRVEANRLKCEAEVVIPAAAEKEALLMKAIGVAATTLEEGKSKAEAIRLLREQWEQQDSKELFMIQLMPELVEKVTHVISKNLNVERLTVVDGGGNGSGLPHLVGSLAGSVNSFFEQLKTLTGLDISQIIEGRLSTSKTENALLK